MVVGRITRPHGVRGELTVMVLSEVPDRESAEALRGAVLVVPESSSPPLADGSWWDHQLVGSTVFTAVLKFTSVVESYPPTEPRMS